MLELAVALRCWKAALGTRIVGQLLVLGLLVLMVVAVVLMEVPVLVAQELLVVAVELMAMVFVVELMAEVPVTVELRSARLVPAPPHRRMAELSHSKSSSPCAIQILKSQTWQISPQFPWMCRSRRLVRVRYQKEHSRFDLQFGDFETNACLPSLPRPGPYSLSTG